MGRRYRSLQTVTSPTSSVTDPANSQPSVPISAICSLKFVQCRVPVFLAEIELVSLTKRCFHHSTILA